MEACHKENIYKNFKIILFIHHFLKHQAKEYKPGFALAAQ